MNLPTAARILGLTQKDVAARMGIGPRALRARLKKAGEKWDISTPVDKRTLDLFTGTTRYDEALAQFDYLLHDFMHRTNRRRKVPKE